MIDKVNQTGYTKDRKLSNNKKRNGVIEMRNEIKKVILNLTGDETWAVNSINEMIEETFELIEKGLKLDDAAFKVVDKRF